jgi:hypothetical protein
VTQAVQLSRPTLALVSVQSVFAIEGKAETGNRKITRTQDEQAPKRVKVLESRLRQVYKRYAMGG